jgi:hypothetical protein
MSQRIATTGPTGGVIARMVQQKLGNQEESLYVSV